MVVRQANPDTDDVFHALADPTRRDILGRTLGREYSVSELAELYPMSFAAVQKHVAVLERAELVTKRAQHRHRFVRGNPHRLDLARQALDRLEGEWIQRLDRFEAALRDDDDGEAES